MQKYLKSLVLAGGMVLAAAPMLAQYPYVIVGGYANFHKPYNQYSFAPINTTYVKFCVDDWSGAGATGSGECYTSRTGTNLSRGTAYYQIYLSPNKTYYFFLWDDSQDWGSQTVPAWTVPSNGGVYYRLFAPSYVPADFNIYQEPRPHKSLAVNPPHNATNVPMVFTLKWSSGIDTLRQWPSVWPVKYDIWAYGEGGSPLKVLSDIPCNPDSSGNCTYLINNVVPNWRYFWKVVGKLQVTPDNRILETHSDWFTFVTQP